MLVLVSSGDGAVRFAGRASASGIGAFADPTGDRLSGDRRGSEPDLCREVSNLPILMCK